MKLRLRTPTVDVATRQGSHRVAGRAVTLAATLGVADSLPARDALRPG